jgi:sugar diacid utilization regulator
MRDTVGMPSAPRNGSSDASVSQDRELLADLPPGDIAALVEAGSEDAGVRATSLGDAVEIILRTIRLGSLPPARDLDRFRADGVRAAADGTPLPALIDLLLSTSWRLWRAVVSRRPSTGPRALAEAGELLLRATDDMVSALARGYVDAQRQAIRREESSRREFVDDLLAGTSEPQRLEGTAQAFGVNLSTDHVVIVAKANRPLHDSGPIHGWVESQVFSRFGASDVIVTTKDGLLVCVFPALTSEVPEHLAGFLDEVVEGGWRIGVGRAESGPSGPARSYRQAIETLTNALRVAPELRVARFDDLLPYHLLGRDPQALSEFVRHTLGDLSAARGGSGPLIETIETYIETSGNTSETARRLFLSPRAVTYRLETIAKLTGRRMDEPEDRFVLELAVRGLRLQGGDAAVPLGKPPQVPLRSSP